MHRIGLALSGGGFRATLFHLGMIRFLREADILPAVTHFTSVSGGSILAAHLVLNWQRYTGSLQEFDDAAAEVIRFVQLDVRNRVVRRYPLALPLRALRRLTFQRPRRQLTMTGLLEYHYEKFLYGDSCLFQLPRQPRLSILATNLSEGCLCAFTRDGLLMQRRQPGRRFRFDRIHTGLATVPMAVTASSAFPGLFREPRPKRLQSASFSVDADTGVLNFWVLLPEGKLLQSFDLLRIPAAKGSAPELITPASHMDTPDGDLLAFSLLSVKPGFTFECRWTHRE
jgi:predicted acylesterase/phospholipase RssA